MIEIEILITAKVKQSMYQLQTNVVTLTRNYSWINFAILQCNVFDNSINAQFSVDNISPI